MCVGKRFFAIVLSALLANTLVATAWAGEDAGTTSAAPGWELIGTCEWQIDVRNCLVIRPADNGAIGQLPDAKDLEEYGWMIWPWREPGLNIEAIRLEGRIVCGDTAGALFSGLNFVTSIEGLPNLDTQKAIDMSSMFTGINNVREIDVSGFVTSNATNISSMFWGCGSLESVDVSGFDTSKVTDMDDLFDGCVSLHSVDVSRFETSRVSRMQRVFSGCSSLQSIDVSNFDTANVVYISDMFGGCSSLRYLDIRGFNTSKVTNAWNLFYDCSSLDLVVLGEGFTLQSELPDKTWYNEAGESFTPGTIPVGIGGTYATSRDLLEPVKVSLSESSKAVSVDSPPFTLKATVTPEWKAGPLSWSSSDPSVASVDNQGKVIALNPGTTTIAAEINGAEGSCNLTVKPVASSADSSGSGSSDPAANGENNGSTDSASSGVTGNSMSASDSETANRAEDGSSEEKDPLAEETKSAEQTGTGEKKLPSVGKTSKNDSSSNKKTHISDILLAQTGDTLGTKVAWTLALTGVFSALLLSCLRLSARRRHR